MALMAQQEIYEANLKGGRGSAKMPHESNPTLAELHMTLARFNATQIAGFHKALVDEKER
jgi:3-carboxy-cis,cis-muconate cycloisomerase